jgi:hypothetical protein
MFCTFLDNYRPILIQPRIVDKFIRFLDEKKLILYAIGRLTSEYHSSQ